VGARRDRDLQHRPVGAVAQVALAVPGARRLVLRPALVGLQVAVGVVADEHDLAAVPAVTAVGPAVGHVRLSAKAQAAVAAAACLNVDASLVVEHSYIRA